MTTTTTLDWTAELAGQLDAHWTGQLRPRLDGLTDEEYFWEPAPGCWSVRPAGTSAAPVSAGSGGYAMDFAFEIAGDPPLTTIAWRLGHLIVGIFGGRVAAHFGGPEADYRTFAFAGTAREALAQLDSAYAAWHAGVSALDPAALARPCGQAEESFELAPMAALVLNINREAIHHGAEIALMRDLYLRK